MTGAVGLAGIAGTLWQAKQTKDAASQGVQVTIEADRQRERLADKRQTYARCLEAFTDLQHAVAVVSKLRSRGAELADAQLAERDRLTAATAALTATWELTLIARADVSLIANRAVEVISADSDAETLGLVFSRLLAAMQADLNGVPIPEAKFPDVSPTGQARTRSD
jgi:hypothetical protein